MATSANSSAIIDLGEMKLEPTFDQPGLHRVRNSIADITGGSMIPTANTEYMAVLNSLPQTWTFNSNYGNREQQSLSARINQTFYVYHEVSPGIDNFYVVYVEDCLFNPGTPVHQTADAVGLATSMLTTSIVPTFDGSAPAIQGVSWAASSPITVNQQVQHQDMVITGTSATIEASQGEDPSTGESESESVQLWNSQTYPITDWGVLEQTDAASNTGKWVWHQQTPWDPTSQSPDNFASWFTTVYDSNDAVIRPANLSMNSLQYQTNITWRFERSLMKNDQLVVTFLNNFSFMCNEVATPREAGTNGHHRLDSFGSGVKWTPVFDLARVLKKTTKSS